MKISTKAIFAVFRSILCITVIVSFVFYFTSRNSIEKSKPIVYRVIEQRQSNWRGTAYKLLINYANREHNISISRATSDSIDNNNFPSLYYNNIFDTAVYDYHLGLSLRIALVVSVLFLLSLLIKPKIRK